MLKLLSSFKTETGVGALIIGGLALIVYSSVVVTGWKAGENSTYRLVVYFDDASGLAASTAVRIAGIKVGNVERIELDRGMAKVSLAIFDQYPVYDDATASVRSLGVLGDKYLEVIQGTPGRERLVDDDEIPIAISSNNLDGILLSVSAILEDVKSVTGALSLSVGGEAGAGKFNRILENTESLTLNLRETMEKTNEKVDGILANLEGFTAGLNQIARENREGISGIVRDFEATSANLRGITEENRQSLKDAVENFRLTGEAVRDLIAENRRSIDGIVGNIESITATLREDTPEITGNFKEILAENRQSIKNTLDRLDDASEKLDRALASLDKSAVNVASITGKIDDGEGTIGRLVNDEETVESVNEALDGLNEILGQATRTRLNMGMRLEYLPGLEGKSTRGAVNFEYQTSPEHSYIIGLTGRPSGKTNRTNTTTSTTVGGVTTTEVEEKNEITEDLLLSLQISQRFYDTRFRIGFFENSVGVGAEQYFGNREQFTLFSEIYDFSRPDEGANLRIGFNWNLWKYFYLTGGGHDLINQIPENRQYFLGLGLEFNEDNLKLLAGSLPLSQF